MTLIFIGLLGIFAYHCSEIGKHFKGSSSSMKAIMVNSGFIGSILYYAFLVWSFWQFPWWQPIVTFISVILVGALSAIFFQRSMIGMIISPILLLCFAILSFIGLI